MRRLMRRLGGAAAARIVDAPLLRRLAAARRLRGVVLNYHVMHADSIAAHLDVLDALFDIVPIEGLLAPDRPPVDGAGGRVRAVLTFDDGKRSNGTEVAPALRRRGIPATFFVTSEPCRTGGLHWFDLARRIERARREREAEAEDVPPLDVRACKRSDAARRDALLGELADRMGVDTRPRDDDDRPLSPEEVGALARDGFEIGSHSATHAILTLESEERVWRELVESKRRIGEWIGAEVRHFAYPNGNASDATEALTRRAGYVSAWTAVQRWVGERENEHRLPRIQIHERYNREEIALKVALGILGMLPNADGTDYAFRAVGRAGVANERGVTGAR